MKAKLTLFLGLSLFVMGFTPIAQNHNTGNKDRIVYVCGKSKIYHNSKGHSALGRCKSGITEMTETKAKNQGKRICKCKG